MNDYISIPRSYFKIYKVASHDSSRMLGNVLIRMKNQHEGMIAAHNGTSVVEHKFYLDEPTNLKELFMPFEYVEEIYRIAVQKDTIKLFEDHAVIEKNKGITAEVPMPDRGLDLAEYPKVEKVLKVRDGAKRIYINAQVLEDLISQFVMHTNDKNNPPKVWIEIGGHNDHVGIRTSNNDPHKIRAAIAPLKVDPEQELNDKQEQLV